MPPWTRALLLAPLLSACGGSEPAPAHVQRPPAPAAAATLELLPEQVLFSFRGKQAEVRRCFEQGSTRGLARLRWVVDVDGTVHDPAIERSTLGEPAVERCLTAVVRGLHFEPREAPARASWTFVRGVADETVLARAAERERDTKKRGKSPHRAGVVLDDDSPGRLSVEEIEGVTDHGFRLYAFCMREGLNRNLRLNGRVSLRFTIDPEGRVSDIRDAGSDLPDPQVIDCVAEAFYAMQFPEPAGGSVHLQYSVWLNEDE